MEDEDLKQAAEEAFPDEEWSEERLGALKTLIKLCSGADYGSEKEESGGGDDHAAKLALIFGGKPKK